ncbi:pilus assembly protein PilP [Agitococcus lubricus]|uniref:Type IV pilus assembly protein PilP n=1 Tax=Agitococcus lubricus TaxID=1077255 RepID=A0A2T5J035_9GAMM|nr:pilus assembly protein PilP [Agitococcus lubricus]PTQ89708.1 type IV pilus assembly protein PilP [Agitococcus lubricus]
MQHIKKVLVVTIAVSTLLNLSGCSSDFDDMRARMEAIRAKPRGKVEPPPEFTPMPTFTYAAHQLRSPFIPPITAELMAIPAGKKVAPDFSRPQEYLERYALEALRMRGTIQKPGGTLYALVEDADGGVQRIKIGSYMGKNHGKVTEIAQGQISLVEIVPDGRDGWVERPRSLIMADK